MASDLYAPGSLACATCGKPANATVLVGKHHERLVCDDCMAKAADWKPSDFEGVKMSVAINSSCQAPSAPPKSRGRPALRRLKFPDHAARGERCPWCQNLKHGRCSGCGQQYGRTDDTTGATARRVTRKPGRNPQVPLVEVAAPSQPNARGEASAPTTAQPVVLVLPEPPSGNRWWRRHGTTMHLSREAKAYKLGVAGHAALLGMNGRPLFAEGPVSVILIWRRARKSGDLDKRLGVLIDALQGSLYANDSQVVQIWARRCDEHPTLAPGQVHVTVGSAT